MLKAEHVITERRIFYYNNKKKKPTKWPRMRAYPTKFRGRVGGF